MFVLTVHRFSRVSVMFVSQVTISTFLVLLFVRLNEGEELPPNDSQQNLILKSLQPPPVTNPDGVQDTSNVRQKRCGGGGCCGGGCSMSMPSKTINIQIQVKKSVARHPAPQRMMVHRPQAVALVPVAVVPVQTYTYAHPAPTCCGGGGGGYGGGKGKWGK